MPDQHLKENTMTTFSSMRQQRRRQNNAYLNGSCSVGVLLLAAAAMSVTTEGRAADAEASSRNYSLAAGQSPTALSVTNASKHKVYANLVLGQPPTSPPANCSNLGTQIQSVSDSNLVFSSSMRNKQVSFIGPPNVTTKGAMR